MGVCGSCGKSLENTTNFCTHCGESLKNNKESDNKSKIISKKKDDELVDLTIDVGGRSLKINNERTEIVKEIERMMDIDELMTSGLTKKILWSGEEKTGLFKKPIEFFLTNNLIICNDPTEERTMVFPLCYVDVVVMNSHRVISRTGIGGYTSLTKGMGIGIMKSSGKSVSIGDVNFLHNGENILTIYNVADPSGFKSLVNQLKKSMNQHLKNLPNLK